MWAPMAGLSPRLALAAFPGAARLCLWRAGAARCKGVPARNRRGLSDFRPKLAPSEGFKVLPPGVSKSRLESKRYILSPDLAETMVPFLLRNDGCDVILEINPGESGVDGVLSDVHPSCTLTPPARGCREHAAPSGAVGVSLAPECLWSSWHVPKWFGRTCSSIPPSPQDTCIPRPPKTFILPFRESRDH